jgi:hypothetical protein
MMCSGVLTSLTDTPLAPFQLEACVKLAGNFFLQEAPHGPPRYDRTSQGEATFSGAYDHRVFSSWVVVVPAGQGGRISLAFARSGCVDK